MFYTEENRNTIFQSEDDPGIYLEVVAQFLGIRRNWCFSIWLKRTYADESSFTTRIHRKS